MPKKITSEEFIERLNGLQNGICAIDLYIDMTTKIRFRCQYGHIWSAAPTNILSGCGCPYCAGRYRTKENIQQILDEMGNNIVITGEYVNMNTKTQFMCERGHLWCVTPSQVLAGSKCPYCTNKKILPGFNDLWTTHSYVAKLLENPDDGYKYTYGSGQRVKFKCPDCGEVCLKSIRLVCRRGFTCPKCSDGISYPNKFARALLKLLPVNNIKHEWQPEWLKPYFYDNYFEYNNQKYVLEMDGGLGHGKRAMGSQEKDIKGLYADQLKDELASQHNIVVIRIDCDYKDDNRCDYIQHNIINSELNQLFDLTNIDWRLCNEQGMKKMVKEVAELYNKGFSTKAICQQTQHSQSTVARWLKQARSVGLCDYNNHEARIRGGLTITIHNIPVNQYTMDGHYVATHVSMTEAKRTLGLSGGNISICCSNPKRSTGGFRWYKASDVNQPDKTKILINQTIQND